MNGIRVWNREERARGVEEWLKCLPFVFSDCVLDWSCGEVQGIGQVQLEAAQ